MLTRQHNIHTMTRGRWTPCPALLILAGKLVLQGERGQSQLCLQPFHILYQVFQAVDLGKGL